MATVIDTLAYKIVADTQGFTAGMTASRKELTAAKQIMRESATDVQMYAARQEAVNRLHQKGLIDARAYAQQMQKLAQAHKEAQGAERLKAVQGMPVVGSLVKAADKIPGVGSLVDDAIGGSVGNAGTAGLAAIVAGAGAAVAVFRSEINKVDEISKAARKATLDPEAFLVLQRAAKLADVDVGSVTASLNKMQLAIGKGAEGGKEQQEAFWALGLSADNLKKLKPEDAFLQISEALRGMRDPYRLATTATAIFGKSFNDVKDVLKMGSGEFAKIRQDMEQRGELFSSEEGAAAESLNDAIGDLSRSYQGLKRSIALEALPAAQSFIAALTNITDEASKAKRALSGTGGGMAAGDRSKNLGELGGLAADTAALFVTRGHADYEESPWKRLQARMADEAKVGGNVEDLTAGQLSAEQVRLNAEAEKLVKQMNEARAAGDQAKTAAIGARMAQLESLRVDAEVAQAAKVAADKEAIEAEKRRDAETKKQEQANERSQKYIDGLKQQAAAIGLTGEAAARAKAEAAGLTGEYLKQAVAIDKQAEATKRAAKAQKEFADAAKDSGKKGTDSLQALWTVQRQAQLQQQGAQDPKQQATDEAAQVRRQVETARMAEQMRRSRSTEADIAKAVALKRQADELERMAPALARRQRLLDEAKAAGESVRTPEQVYAENVRKFNEMLDAGGISLKQYAELKRRAGQEMAQALPGGDRRAGVEAVTFGSSGAADIAYQAQRQMAAIQKQAAIDSTVARDQERKKLEADLGLNQDPAAQSWERQLDYQATIARYLERIAANTPQIAGTP